MSPERKPRSMMPMPPSSAMAIAISARVIVSMLAETIGRRSRSRCGELTGQIDRGRIAPLDDAVLRGEEKVVERAAADQLKQIRHRTGAERAYFAPKSGL